MTQKELYHYRKERGICVACGKNPAMNGNVRCDKCNEYATKAARKHFEKNRKSAYIKCEICGKRVKRTGNCQKYCEECKTVGRNHGRVRRLWEKNLDIDCVLSRAYLNGEVSGKDDWQCLQDTDRAMQGIRQKISDEAYLTGFVLPPEFQAVWIYSRRLSASRSPRQPLDPDVKAAIFEEQDGLCYLCGESLYGRLDDPLSIEHKIPISRGGSDDVSNIALAHLSCNMRKGTKTPEEFLQARSI